MTGASDDISEPTRARGSAAEERLEASYEATIFIRDTCLCLGAQRAARALARRFDEALKPVGLTSGQFSLLTSLNRPTPPGVGSVANLLAMDRTTLTANLKPLERRGLLVVEIDPKDRRGRLLRLTPAGLAAIAAATPIWERAHADAEAALGGPTAADMRARLDALR